MGAITNWATKPHVGSETNPVEAQISRGFLSAIAEIADYQWGTFIGLIFLSASQIKTIYLLVVIKILDGKEQPSKMYQAP